MLARLERSYSAAPLAALSLLAACDRPAASKPTGVGAPRQASNEAAYHPAPSVEGVVDVNGRVEITGKAQPGVPVGLATPEGRAVATTAGPTGRWRIVLPASSQMRVFGLSMIDGGRAVQSEGYLAVAPDLAAQLRAGAGAIVHGAAAEGPRVLAIDFDGKGGCVVSGVTNAGHAVEVRIDGVRRGAVRANSQGRFALALDEPVTTGAHTIEAVEGEKHAAVTIAVSPGVAPGGPLSAERADGGWRVDWTTPGGGPQTTMLFAPPPAPSTHEASA